MGLDFDYDYVIIGSGFGGSVSAMRLSEKGYKVAVLEAGRRFRPEDHAKTTWDLRNYAFLPKLGMRGIMRYTLLPHVMIVSGAGVGGGSLVYANTLYVPPDPFFRHPRWAHIQDWKAALMPHYATAERMLGVVDSPFIGHGDRLLEQCAQDVGRGDTFRPTRVAVYFGDGPGQKHADPYFGGEGPERTGCNFCGGCMVGCRHGSKNTLDKNYLWFAEKRGTRIFPERAVTDVKPLAHGGYEVTHERSGAWFARDRHVLRAKGVVFSAGVLGTVKLLMACKDRGSLPDLSHRLGHHVMTNSESILGVTAKDYEHDYSRGIAISASVFPDEHTHIEVCRFSKGSDLNKLLTAYLTDGGTRLTRPMKFLANLLYHPVDFFRALWPFHWAERTCVLLVMQTLENSIRLVPKRLPGGGIRLSSALEEGTPIPAYIPVGNDFARRMAKKMNGVPQSTVTEVLLNVPITAHILGGAGIGDSPDTGVIDQNNRVFGYDDLYVCDGSTIPANLGVNPSLTITALSEHAMAEVPAKSRPAAAATA